MSEGLKSFSEFIKGERYIVGKNILAKQFIWLFLMINLDDAQQIVENVIDLEHMLKESAISSPFIKELNNLLYSIKISKISNNQVVIEFWVRSGYMLRLIRISLANNYTITYTIETEIDIKNILKVEYYVDL